MTGLVKILENSTIGFNAGTFYTYRMTTLLWQCPKCLSGNDRMEAVFGRRRYWLFGKRERLLRAICNECEANMDFVGTF